MLSILNLFMHTDRQTDGIILTGAPQGCQHAQKVIIHTGPFAVAMVQWRKNKNVYKNVY